jgi:hypothetical protein
VHAGPGCRKGVVIAPSAGLINTLYGFIGNVSKAKAGTAPQFLSAADPGHLLLLAHSLGAFVAFKALAGALPILAA